jgi:hypothetical protein
MQREHAAAIAFFEALRDNDEAALVATMAPDAGLRAWRSGARISTRPAERVVRWFRDERAQWDEAQFDMVGLTSDRDDATIEFRIQATTGAGIEDHERVALLTFDEGRVHSIHLYCADPMPAARRGWVAPVDVDDATIERMLSTYNRDFDSGRPIPVNRDQLATRSIIRGTTGEAHPGTNTILGARWSADEAEDRISEVIDWHRDRNLGFHWIVGPWDTPRDLRERLERHGLVYAGDQAMMVRRGLDPADVPTNPAVTIEELTVDTPDAIEAALQITGTAFQWPPEQVAAERQSVFEEVRSRQGRYFLARLDGVAVAEAQLYFRGGFAYLGGAATLPEYRSQRVYSTLLHKRLQVAHDAGYSIGMIISEPMSRRVVQRYGFETKAMCYVYGWMPVIDPAAIRTLVQDQ